MSISDFKNVDEQESNSFGSNVEYFKKIVKPSTKELENHKSYLNKNLKKNYY